MTEALFLLKNFSPLYSVEYDILFAFILAWDSTMRFSLNTGNDEEDG